MKSEENLKETLDTNKHNNIHIKVRRGEKGEEIMAENFPYLVHKNLYVQGAQQTLSTINTNAESQR